MRKINFAIAVLLFVYGINAQEKQTINWTSFMAKQDMVWDKTPKKWQEAPYLGNGMVGLMLFQPNGTAKNILELHVGRGDYYDNRPPHEGNENTWIYRGRLPIGHFKIKSKGDIIGVDWKLDLYRAELSGTVTTKKGSYHIHSYVQSNYDSYYFKADNKNGENISLEWFSDEAYSHPRSVSEKTIARKGDDAPAYSKNFVKAPYPKAPSPFIKKINDVTFSLQTLHADSGQLVNAWKEISTENSLTVLGTVNFSKNVGTSFIKSKEIITKATSEINAGTYEANHRKWWSNYYPQSFLSISDAFWEQFYWIQMYKFASSTRSNGMLLDVMGPWYQPGFWPLIWTDLNVQLTYWTPLVANRLNVGESLPNQMDLYEQNLINNLPEGWCDDCLNAGTVFPADMKAKVGRGVSDHIVWMLHDYWLWCEYADDRTRMKDGLFPLLKKATNVYFQYIKDNPMPNETDGKIHIKSSWSPEYPGGTGKDINYTLSLIKWSCQTLLNISKEHHLNDPKEADWQDMLDNLVDYQKDENGLKIGADIPFEKAHRHYSHLLAFYPLYLLTPDSDYELLKTSVDHWLETSFDSSKKKDKAMSVTGYTCSGAASMYASLKDGNTALSYLQKLPFTNVSSTTMYSEGNNPVIESPFSAATSIHDMLLQSWDGKIRVFPAVPSKWKDIYFKEFRTQGGLLVTANLSNSKPTFLTIKAPEKDKNIEFSIDIKSPKFIVVDSKGKEDRIKLKLQKNGFYKLHLQKGQSLQVKTKKENELSVVKSADEQANIFGLNKKYDQFLRDSKNKN